VFVEANVVAAGIEALVLAGGECNVPRMNFLKVLWTFAPKQNLTMSADASGLRIEGFLRKATVSRRLQSRRARFKSFR